MTVLSAAIDQERDYKRSVQDQRRQTMEEQQRKQKALQEAKPKEFVHMHPAAKRG
jgi:hypothetical protein